MSTALSRDEGIIGQLLISDQMRIEDIEALSFFVT